MPSILPGYNYDIFVSYRHKDNKYDGWVTEFVQNLKKELDATFKDEISIYFDFNPDDGLLETHNVDKSLEGKLNCVIFIPVLSQTYCDPRSFSWQHEFCAFNEFAKGDKFGRDIQLRNGNVASRILPIRVRELDAEDKKMIEDELGSVLRPIDFIYKEQGVNRPLKPEDPEEKNLNHTKYRNQINKTANAIKEIFTAVKWKQSGEVGLPPVITPPTEERQVIRDTERRDADGDDSNRGRKRKRTPLEIIVRGVIILTVISFVFYWRDKDNNESDDENSGRTFEKSIAVLPFEDLSSGHDQEYFSDGIAEEILNSLAQIKGLKVAGRTSSFQFKGQKTDLKDVGSKLNVANVLEGSVRKSGNRVRITAQLIGVRDGYHIWSETYDRDMTDIFAIQDEVASKIAEVLLKELAVTKAPSDHTENVKAYEYYLQGKYINMHQFVVTGKTEDFQHAVDLFKKSIELDSNYALAHAGLSDLYNTYTNVVKRDTQYLRLQQKEIDIARRINPDLDYVQNVIGNVELTKGNYERSYAGFMKAVELNPNDANNLMALALLFMRVGLPDQSITLMDRAVRLDPLEPMNHTIRGSVNFQLGKYKEAEKDLAESLRQQPENYSVVIQLGFLRLIDRDLKGAKVYIDKALVLRPEITGAFGLMADYEAAMGHKEKALKLQPDFRTFIILGMKKEAADGVIAFFSQRPPNNTYIAMTRDNQITSLSADPRIKELLVREKAGYEENKKKFKSPVLQD